MWSGEAVAVSALRSASVCRFFSGVGVHCMRGDTFLRGCVFALVLAFGLPFKQIIWHPEDRQTVSGLGLQIYWVLLSVGGWGEGSQ